MNYPQYPLQQVAVAKAQDEGESLYVLDKNGELWEQTWERNPLFLTSRGNRQSIEACNALRAEGHEEQLMGWKQVSMVNIAAVKIAAAAKLVSSSTQALLDKYNEHHKLT